MKNVSRIIILSIISMIFSVNILCAAEKKKEEEKEVKKSWADKIKVKGDLRLRYQTEFKSSLDENEEWIDAPRRDRVRYRFRLGAKAKVNKMVNVGFGLASGSDDARSTNQTFEGFFSSKPIQIDLAYATFTPWKVVSLTAGKMKNPIFQAADLLWDSDINPEGIALNANYNIGKAGNLFFNGAGYLAEEEKELDNSHFFAFQAGTKITFSQLFFQLAGTYYNPTHLDLQGYSRDYDSIAVDFKAGYKLNKSFQLGLFGQYVVNISDLDVEDEDKNMGYLFGIKGGSHKVEKLGDFEVKAMYRTLQKYAFLDILPDSDAMGGGLDNAGIEVAAKIGLMKGLCFGLDYYNMWTESEEKNKEHLFQADLKFKF